MSKLFGSKPAPQPEPPAPTPMMDEKAIEQAKKKTAARVRSTSGRDSTILAQADKLGG